MIYLSTTQSKVATVTLYENAGNKVNPQFTWKIKHTGTHKETVFYQSDGSTAPYYYNSFTLSIGTFSGLTAGQFKYGVDIVEGQYDYTVYEMSNPFDLDISNSIGVVETGILIVEGENQERTSYKNSPDVRSAYKNY